MVENTEPHLRPGWKKGRKMRKTLGKFGAGRKPPQDTSKIIYRTRRARGKRR